MTDTVVAQPAPAPEAPAAPSATVKIRCITERQPWIEEAGKLRPLKKGDEATVPRALGQKLQDSDLAVIVG